MRIRGHYTPEQINLLKSHTPIRVLADLPIFQGHNPRTLQSARDRYRGMKNTPPPPQEYLGKGIAYKGEKVQLYQFISTDQATIERTKEWLDVNKTERRKMSGEINTH